MRPRFIIHADMDAFFASIEQLDYPEFRNKPVVVGADPQKGHGRGVVSAASYEARKFGIHSALPISMAYKRNPDAIFVRPRMQRYADVSREVMKIFREFSPVIEQISIDEAFIDCTSTLGLHKDIGSLCRLLQNSIKERLGLTVSMGVASNKSIAKIASSQKKPFGITIVEAGCEKKFLAPLAIKQLWGAGERTRDRLNSMGIFTIGELAAYSRVKLSNTFGKAGERLHDLANAIDDREVSEAQPLKSISRETTFDQDTNDLEKAEKMIFRMSDILARHLREKKVKGKTISIKIRYSDFVTVTRARTLQHYFDISEEIFTTSLQLFRENCETLRPLRLIGVKISHLNNKDKQQLDLFSDFESNRGTARAEMIIDSLQKRFAGKITKAAML